METANEEHESGARTALEVAEKGHLAYELATEGGHDFAEVVEHGTTPSVGGVAGAGLSVVGGGFHLHDGFEQIAHGDKVGGGLTVAQGGCEVASGIASTVGMLAESAVGATAAPILGALGLGLGVGKVLAPGAAEGARNFAHDRRVERYNGDGLDGITRLGYRDARDNPQLADKGTRAGFGAADDLATYEDAAEEAVAKSKKDHPERWGGAPIAKVQR